MIRRDPTAISISLEDSKEYEEIVVATGQKTSNSGAGAKIKAPKKSVAERIGYTGVELIDFIYWTPVIGSGHYMRLIFLGRRFYSSKVGDEGVDLFFRKSASNEKPNGVPIIILHGLLGNSKNWRSIANALRDSGPMHRDVYALDLRNHGNSPHRDSMKYSEMAGDVKRLMEKENIEKATIVGHSMGGKLAMEMSSRFPDAVDRLCVVDIAPVRYTDYAGITQIFEAMESVDFTKVSSRKDVDNALSQMIPNAGERMFVLTNLEKNQGVFSWKANLKALVNSYHDVVKDNFSGLFEGKTLFIRGSKSPYVKDEYIPLIRQKFPFSRVETVPGAGHWVHAENPKLVIQLILDFEKDHHHLS
eukprot:Nk52_evm40s270 gene=Nk52_evmTU40s270